MVNDLKNKKIPNWMRNGFNIYYGVLYDTNKMFIKLLGLSTSVYDKADKVEELFLKISQNICWLMPCRINRNKRDVELCEDDGILDFKNEIPYLLEDYSNIFNDSKDAIYTIKKLRNKVEHQIHKIDIPIIASSTNPDSLEILINISDEKYNLKAGQLKILLIGLNKIFDKMIKDIIILSEALDKKDHPFVVKYTSRKFEEFNDIINSNVILQVGRIID